MRRIDHGYIVVFLICFLAIWPFLANASLPHDTDAELHIFRLAELERMLAGGVWYPRWAANFYYGYGYPIFNYYAPLAYYLGALISLFPTVSPVDAVKALFILSLLGAGIGMYGFVRDNWGRWAGYVACASYVYAPYILYIDPHARGVLPELLAFAIFPFALWSLDRLRHDITAKRFAVASILLAALILTHNLMAMILGPLLFAWFVWQAALAVRHAKNGMRLWIFGNLAFVLGVGLSAFFWLPMVLEQDAIQIGSVVGEGSHYDYRNHFLTIGEIFGRSQRLDWGASEPLYNRNLGLVQWILGTIGAMLLIFGKVKNRSHALFFVFPALLFIFLMLPASQPLWQAIPPLKFLQFPWRLLGATNAMLAILAGIAISQISYTEYRIPNTVYTFLLLIIILTSLPLTQVAPYPDFGPTTERAVLESELLGRWRGTTSTADFVPITVTNEPREEQQLIREYFQGLPHEHLNRATLGDATVTTEIVTPIHTRYSVDTPDFLILRLFRFYFPGWTATVDGEPVEIEIAQPEGFITIPVEAGQHTVELKFDTTPPRTWGWIVAGLSLLCIGLIVFKLPSTSDYELRITNYELRITDYLPLILLIVLHILVIEPFGLLRLESAENRALPAQHDTFASFGDQLALIGYDGAPLVAGRPLDLMLYWQAQRQPDENYQVFVHLLRVTDGITVVAQSDKANPGDFPTEQWPLDKYVRDHHRLDIPADLPAGEYHLTTGINLWATGERLPVAGGEWHILQQFTIDE